MSVWSRSRHLTAVCGKTTNQNKLKFLIIMIILKRITYLMIIIIIPWRDLLLILITACFCFLFFFFSKLACTYMFLKARTYKLTTCVTAFRAKLKSSHNAGVGTTSSFWEFLKNITTGRYLNFVVKNPFERHKLLNMKFTLDIAVLTSCPTSMVSKSKLIISSTRKE